MQGINTPDTTVAELETAVKANPAAGMCRRPHSTPDGTYVCTRPHGHDGDHQAGTGRWIAVVWPRDLRVES